MQSKKKQIIIGSKFAGRSDLILSNQSFGETETGKYIIVTWYDYDLLELVKEAKRVGDNYALSTTIHGW